MRADRLLAPIVIRCALLGGVVLLAAVPVYVYVEPSWRTLVARLAVAFVLGVALLQLRGAVVARLARAGGSPLEHELGRLGNPPAVPLRFEELIDDVRATRRSRGHFERIMWPRLTALASRPLVAAAGPVRSRAQPGRPAPRDRRDRARGGRAVKVAVVAERVREVVATLGRIVVGKDDVLERILAGILANGHVLIEDYPGLAKTLIARLLAQALDLGFRRIQFTPDLLPSDITGSFLYDQRESRFEFRAGPVFTNLLLADEINRATPKTQAALLEAMQEGQVTIEGQSFPLEQPFVVIATQNPIEMEGTYPLPEAQLDRFLLRVGVGYPEADAEREILKRRRERRTDAAAVPTIVTRAELLAMQGALEDVFVSEALERYIVALAQATRTDPRVTLGASPRGSLALLKLARAEAAIRGRDFVLPDDVKAVAVAALAHRLVLRPELWVSSTTPRHVVESVLREVPAPAGDPA